MQITTTAATTPPTMAPTFEEEEDEEELEADGVGDSAGEPDEVLRLVRDEEDCDVVVDASTLFAAARSVSVPPLVPHAMYS